MYVCGNCKNAKRVKNIYYKDNNIIIYIYYFNILIIYNNIIIIIYIYIYKYNIYIYNMLIDVYVFHY